MLSPVPAGAFCRYFVRVCSMHMLHFDPSACFSSVQGDLPTIAFVSSAALACVSLNFSEQEWLVEVQSTAEVHHVFCGAPNVRSSIPRPETYLKRKQNCFPINKTIPTRINRTSFHETIPTSINRTWFQQDNEMSDGFWLRRPHLSETSLAQTFYVYGCARR